METNFTDAIETMVKTGEFEKIYNNVTYFERKKVRHDEEICKECIDENGKFKQGYQIPLMANFESIEVLRDLVCMMVR